MKKKNTKNTNNTKTEKKPEDAAAMQQKYMQYQMLEQQSKQMQEQLQKVAEQLYELEFIIQSLGEYNKVENGKEMLSPISSGIFVKSKVADSKSFYVNVGSNVVVKKNLEQTKTLMNQQILELKNAQGKIMENFQHVNSQLELMQGELMKLSGQ